MATKRRRVRKTRSRRRSRKSCKHGKLKRRVKTKSGRKRRCKKSRKRRKTKSRRRKRKYRVGGCSGLRKTINPKCEDNTDCKWGSGQFNAHFSSVFHSIINLQEKIKNEKKV